MLQKIRTYKLTCPVSAIQGRYYYFSSFPCPFEQSERYMFLSYTSTGSYSSKLLFHRSSIGSTIRQISAWQTIPIFFIAFLPYCYVLSSCILYSFSNKRRKPLTVQLSTVKGRNSFIYLIPLCLQRRSLFLPQGESFGSFQDPEFLPDAGGAGDLLDRHSC